ncbi:HpcH/HpaI aldolase/citrate lyase family protein [Haliea sp. E17]|uniref:HpcH/HpaI aldolase/citrate lyase family protein n=1 Tax=Haliea sp. E17 TaxID=3401576 RepID=UPI003AAD8956
MASIARSLLFVPGDRPERFEKAAAAGAHEVVIDLEDAVAFDNKEEARQATADWLARGVPTTVRINGMESEWFAADLDLLAQFPGAGLMLPKAEVEAVQHVAGRLPGRPVTALVETVRGVMGLREITAAGQVQRLAFGSVDFSLESGISDDGEALTSVRNRIVLESCLARLLPPVDGVSVEFNDVELIRQQALRSRSLGFGGKLCIHPRQVDPVNSAFAPSAQEIEWARRVIDAAKSSNGGAVSVDGKMIDRPILLQAERIIESCLAGSAGDGVDLSDSTRR